MIKIILIHYLFFFFFNQISAYELFLLKTGENISPQFLVYKGGDFFNQHQSIHSTFLYKSKHGNILIDTGLGRNIEKQFHSFPYLLRGLFRYEKLNPAINQLKDLNIDKILMTHLHWDHTSGLDDFIGAEVITSEEALQFANSEDVPRRSYIKNSYTNPQIKWKTIKLEKRSYLNFSESLDLFGDGSVMVVSLPGHAEGSLGYIIENKYFFIGDTIWSMRELELLKGKSSFGSMIVDQDKKEVLSTIEKLKNTLKIRPDLILVPAHDGEYLEKMFSIYDSKAMTKE